MGELSSIKDWATEQFASADFGDVRRGRRAGRMLRRAAEKAAGRLSEVFASADELQAAYDFVEGPVSPAAITRALAEATLRAADDADAVYVPVDGTSLSLTDLSKSKGFGSVGKRAFPTRGLKVIDAIAVGLDGTPLGILDLEWWARGLKKKGSRYTRRRSGTTEVNHWVTVIGRTAALLREEAPQIAPWFLIDREGDSVAILDAVSQPGQWFTVRSTQDRPVRLTNGRQRKLSSHMKKQPVRGQHFVDVPAGPNRSERRAKLDIRFAEVVLDLPDRATGKRKALSVRVVWAHERRAPYGEKPLDWMLLTNRDVGSFEDAISIVKSYTHRWRVEDFHRSWKRGHCNVEDTQLRAKDNVIRWATMLAAIAMRVERLKHLARTQPDAPAGVELAPIEIEALRAAKARSKKWNETLPLGMPTIETAVRWIAEMGGYTGKSSGGPPGAITIGRGLERLMIWADAFACAKDLEKK